MLPFGDTANQKAHLLRGIGFIGASLLVLNSVIGAGIFALPAVIVERTGVLSPWLFLLVGILVITIVLTLAELASYFKDTGGPALFTATAFGPLAGFSTGWILYVSRMTAYAANSTVMAMYLGEVWPWFRDGIGRLSIIFAVCGILTITNYTGVRDGVRTMAVITLFKVAPILMLILLGLPYVSGDTLIPASVPQILDPGGTALLLIYAYIGFESATVTSGETQDPTRTIPRALIFATIVAAVIYFLILLVYISVVPVNDGTSATLVDVGRELLGPTGVIIVTFAAFFSISGNLSGVMLDAPRLTFALAEQRLLPQWFGRVHDKYSTPANSILFFGIIGFALAASGTFAYLAAASSLTRLLAYILSILALPAIRRKCAGKSRATTRRLLRTYLIPTVALVLCCWIVLQSTSQSWTATAGLLVTGLTLYAVSSRRKASSGPE